jgi:membrane-associated protease RseP (regulator of RpoE activity)
MPCATGPSFFPCKQTRGCKTTLLILTIVISLALAMLVHELGHLIAARGCKVPASEVSLGLGPRLLGFQLRHVRFSLRAIPLGSFVRLDGDALHARAIHQQLFVHLGGIALNIIAGIATFGTTLGWINFLVAAGNILPLYQHDGWKCGVVIMRSLLRRKSQPIEWAFTFSGGFVSFAVVWAIIRLFI